MIHQKMFARVAICCLLLSSLSQASAQLVINELVQDNRTNGNGNTGDDFGEFIELYNSSGGDVDLTGWTLNVIDLDDGSTLVSAPLSGTILASDPYYVIANSSGVPGSISPSLIDFNTGANSFLVNDNNLFELRNPGGNLVDALGIQLTFDPQYDFVTTEQRAQIGNGGWSQLITTVETPQSYGRYIDGRDTDFNGRDFGVIPQTPGASNTLPLSASVVPDVSALALGSAVPGFSYSFVGPKVVDPTVVGTYVKHAVLSPPPQGSKVIAAWDQTGGGNMVASNSLTTSFDINAYIDTAPLNIPGTAFEWDVTTYGIGTTDAFFGSPDPTDIFTTAAETTNGNTGVGWLYLREQASGTERLMLIDFNDGGDSLPTGNDWTILETIDMTSSDPGWHRLAIDYDPQTGEVVARFNDQVFTHDIGTEVIGTFYVGFREALSGGVPATVGPPLFQMHIEEEGLAGDFDDDGDVDGRDFLLWQRNTAIGDLADWQANYGMTGPLSGLSSVPEPTSGILTMTAAVLLVGRARRK
jgi:hypothetical protein